MIEQALKLAADFDELAEIGFEQVLRSESDSLIAQQLAQLHIKYAKEHQANAQLLRDMVAKIEGLQAENDALNLELGNEINIEEWAKAQRAVKKELD